MEVEEFLAHHGIKGMHWGVRKNRESSGESGSQDPGIVSSPRTKAEASQRLGTNESNSVNRIAPSDGEGKRLTDSQKKALKIAGAVAIAGGIAALGLYEAKNNPEFAAKLASLAGKKISPADFKKASKLSEADSWGYHNFIQPTKLNKEDTSFPAGHLFHRLSMAAETNFSDATYATASHQDFGKYVVNFAPDLSRGKLYHVTWHAKEEIRVPSLTHTLETFHEAMAEELKGLPADRQARLHLAAEGGHYLSKHNVAQMYESAIGGDFGHTSVEKSFVARLKAKGYHAVIDEMDSGVRGDLPLVILSPEKMGSKVANVLSVDEVKRATETLTELADRKLSLKEQGLYNSATQEVNVEVDEYMDFFAVKDEELTHHGVKGMHWGEHHARRMARADANEFAKARAYYGQGAGTRRKLIKAKVETRSSNPHYKKEFDRTLSGQNLEKRSSQAIRKRRRADTKHFLGKTSRGVHRSLSGGFGPVTATAATIAAGAGYAHKTGLDKVVFDKVKKAATSRSTQENVRQFLKSQGLG